MNNRIPILQMLLLGFLPNFMKIFIYRIKGYKIHKNVKICLGSIIISDECEIKENTYIGFFTIIQSKKVTIGSNSQIRSFVLIDTPIVEIGNDVIICEMTVIRAGHKSLKSIIKIDDRVHIFNNVIIDPSCAIYIGTESAIGFYSNLYTHGAYKNILEGYKVTYGEIKIGKRVELTHNVFVAPGVSIEDDVIVGYGSYVNKNLPYGVLAAGIPVQIKREKTQFAPVPCHQEKISIVNEIVDKFCEFMIFEGIVNDFSKAENEWTLIERKNNTRIFLCSEINQTTAYNKNDIILFLTENCPEQHNKGQNFINYFCLSHYCCSYSETVIIKKLRRFFGRYGIRFNLIKSN